MNASRARRPTWFVVLFGTLLSVLGCHVFFGSFEEGPPSGSVPAGGVCKKGASRCNDEFLLTCNADQSGWVKADTCASKEQCDSASGRCLVCPKADARRCNGARLEACSADRTSWTLKQDCTSAEMCSPGGCGPCDTPGQLQCTVDAATQQSVIRECDPTNKVWNPVTSCPNDDVCMATLSKAQSDLPHWNRMCTGACTPGQIACDGVNLQRCPANAVAWMPVSSCATPELCLKTVADVGQDANLAATLEQCEAGCGTPGAPRCQNGSILQRCSADQTAWATVMECPSGMQCTTQGQGDCVVCTPGDYQCNGAGLERCGDDHVWKPVQDCKTQALCKVQTDPNTGMSMGSCTPPVCAHAGDNVCGTDTDPKTPGATLWECNADLTGYVKGLACDTPELCHAADKACALPMCHAGNRRCDPNNLLQVEACNPGETAWDLVTTCKTGEFCDANDSAQPCKHDCPASLLCNDRFLQTCSATAGVVDKAQCDSKELCQCVLSGTCPAGTKDGSSFSCGKPVCGLGTLPSFKCTDSALAATSGAVLATCKAGYDGWNTAQTCGAANLCDVSDPKAGFCAVCPTAGATSCTTDSLSVQTCASGRKSFTNATACGFGCVLNGNAYCAACFASEKRCNGSSLQSCSGDQKVLTTQSSCSFGCVNSGNTDYCGICAAGETRCNGTAAGSKLQVCNATQTGLTDQSTCAFGCVDNNTADYCAECNAGESQCSGAGVRVCGSNGKWGTVSACTNGTCIDKGTADYCPGCQAGETRCSGSTLQQCSADQTTLTTKMDCGSNGCVDNGTVDYCAACQTNELRCSAGALQQCSVDRKSLTTTSTCSYGCIDSGIVDYCAVCSAGELRCSGSTLQLCAADQKSLISSQSCTSGPCFDSGVADYCGDCTPGDQRCSGTGLQTCGSNGHWGTAAACANGCFGTSPKAYCGVCTPSVDTQCSGSNLQSCTAAGQWSTTTTACSLGCIDSGTKDYCAQCNANDKSCSGSTLQTCTAGKFVNSMTCSLGCFGSSPSAYCGVCNAGDLTCSGAALQQCANGQWGAGSTCANGCFGTTPSSFCGVCPVGGSQCATPSTRQTCNNGQWSAPSACTNNACVAGMCAQCTPTTTTCSDASHVKTCDSSGSWGAATACPNNACVNEACADCMPNSVQCMSTTDSRTCSAAGTWGAATPCPNGACVSDTCADCMPAATACVNSTQSKTCDSTGHWGAATACTSGACVGSSCGACAPSTTQCVGTTQVQACGSTGQWGTATDCDYGCVDNGTADYCRACPVGGAECVDANTLRTCASGGWMTSTCMNGCYDTAGVDYCRDCAMDAVTCFDGTHTQACTADGHWDAPVACPQACLNGACVACAPGTSMCDTDGVSRLTCSQAGSWSAPEACPTTCDAMTGNCTP